MVWDDMIYSYNNKVLNPRTKRTSWYDMSYFNVKIFKIHTIKCFIIYHMIPGMIRVF